MGKQMPWLLAAAMFIMSGCGADSADEWRESQKAGIETQAQKEEGGAEEKYASIILETGERNIPETLPKEPKDCTQVETTAVVETSETSDRKPMAEQIKDKETNSGNDKKETEANREKKEDSRLSGAPVRYDSGCAELTGPYLVQPSVPSKDGYTGIRWFADEEHTAEIQFPLVITDSMRKNGITLYPVYAR